MVQRVIAHPTGTTLAILQLATMRYWGSPYNGSPHSLSFKGTYVGDANLQPDFHRSLDT